MLSDCRQHLPSTVSSSTYNYLGAKNITIASQYQVTNLQLLGCYHALVSQLRHYVVDHSRNWNSYMQVPAYAPNCQSQQFTTTTGVSYWGSRSIELVHVYSKVSLLYWENRTKRGVWRFCACSSFSGYRGWKMKSFLYIKTRICATRIFWRQNPELSKMTTCKTFIRG